MPQHRGCCKCSLQCMKCSLMFRHLDQLNRCSLFILWFGYLFTSILFLSMHWTDKMVYTSGHLCKIRYESQVIRCQSKECKTAPFSLILRWKYFSQLNTNLSWFRMVLPFSAKLQMSSRYNGKMMNCWHHDTIPITCRSWSLHWETKRHKGKLI